MRFMTLGPDVDVIKLLYANFYNKVECLSLVSLSGVV
jgi:hypothetical protein